MANEFSTTPVYSTDAVQAEGQGFLAVLKISCRGINTVAMDIQTEI
jgi:hypothetical protein